MFARRPPVGPTIGFVDTESGVRVIQLFEGRGQLDAFGPAGAERFRQGRHESEYFDPARPVDKTADDARWAIDLATKAIDAVDAELSAG